MTGRPGLRCGIAVALLAGALAPLPAGAARRTVTLTPAQLDAALESAFPRRSCLFVACITLREPHVRLVDGEPWVYVAARVQPELPGAPPAPSGSIEVRARPRYEAGEGAFYADDTELVSLSLPGVPSALSGQAGDLSGGLLDRVLGRQPVYRFDESQPQEQLARLVLRQVRVSGGNLHLIVGDDEPVRRPDEFDPGPTRSPQVPPVPPARPRPAR